MLKFSHRRHSETGLTIGLLLTTLPSLALAATSGHVTPASPRALRPQVAWQLHLPSGKTVQFSSYHLLNGHIYAVGTDGTIIAVRADSGQVAWMRRLADEGDALWPPTSYHSSKEDAIGFTRLHDVILVDPKNGMQTHRLEAAKTSNGPATFSPGHVYLISAGGNMSAYRLKDEYISWRTSFEATLSIQPMYVPGVNLVIAVDDMGVVAGMNAEDRTDKRILFKQDLRSKPQGWMAFDGSMLYLSTDNQFLHAIAMGPAGEQKKQGEIVWQYRLTKPPAGGPILSETAIYQATIGGGLHRIPKFPGEFKAWYAPNAKRYMAEWPEGVVILTNDEKLALISDDPAKPVIIGDARGFTTGISNPFNDAIYLTTPAGTIRCLRPANASPIALASFMPASANASAPAEEEPESFRERFHREVIERKHKGKTPTTTAKTTPTPKAAAAVAAKPVAVAPEAPPLPPDPLRSKIPVVK